MSDTLIIVPSRGRPANIERLVQACCDTDMQADMVVALDGDDEGNYPRLPVYWFKLFYSIGVPRRIGPIINTLAVGFSGLYKYVGFMGDDHYPTTYHWDQLLTDAISETGIAYGNDLLQGEKLPTAVVMSMNIVQTLGYMVPEGLQHLYFDNTWKNWGEAIRRLHYLPDVVIEHMHPHAGKAPWDPGYEVVNGGEMYEHDRAEFALYMEGRFDSDVAKLKQLTES